ncbi:MAG: putative porin [Cyclobacteriaceae bacterium]|nr:putative porin [Cyclobacteriaceae bacterium]
MFLRFFFVCVCGLLAADVGAQRPAPPATDYQGMGGNRVDTVRGPLLSRKGKGSQIVDDSTKNVYGPKTTLWSTETDFFRNRPAYRPLDTLITNYHWWTFMERLQFLYQDLGVNGTALNPILPTPTTTIGATPGFSVYEPYYTLDDSHYYNTRSPYSSFNLVWGGLGRAQTKVEFSRNINPRWNFGFNYRPILTDKQIDRRRKGDRLVIHHSYELYSTFLSKDSNYFLLGSLKRMRHRVNDNGGVFLNNRDSVYADYFSQNIQPFLTTAQSEELRTQAHLFHQYRLANSFQVYHVFDAGRQFNAYRDQPGAEQERFYDTLTIPVSLSATTNDRNNFNFTQNEVGIKGSAGFLFYNFYYRLRSFENANPGLARTDPRFFQRGIENYVGARVATQFDSVNFLSGHAEYLLDGNYRIQGQLVTPWIEGYLVNSLAKAAFKPQGYFGRYNFWVNDFDDVASLYARSFLKIKWGRLLLMPGASYSLTGNYIYFEKRGTEGQTVLPYQSGGIQQVFMPELRFDLRFFRHFHLRPYAVYNAILQNADQALALPSYLANVQIAYENVLFKNAIRVQVGVDVHARPAYFAMGYAPSIQQFFVQREVETPAYRYLTLFVNGQFKRGRFFVKYNNLLQPFLGFGFMPVPAYPGQRNLLDFGFDLILFD